MKLPLTVEYIVLVHSILWRMDMDVFRHHPLSFIQYFPYKKLLYISTTVSLKRLKISLMSLSMSIAYWFCMISITTNRLTLIAYFHLLLCNCLLFFVFERLKLSMQRPRKIITKLNRILGNTGNFTKIATR